jgi:hypothetical protein
VGTTVAEQERRRRDTDRIYARRNLSPDAIAAAIVDAVRRDRPVVAVGAEAHLARALSRLSPGFMRRLARVEMAR